MNQSKRAGLFVLLAALAIPAAARAQAPLALDGEETLFRDRIMEREVVAAGPLVPGGGRYVVVHLAENRVFVFDDDEAVWSAPAGTGTGFRLERGDHRWTFTTPKGLFKIKRMEKNPIWIAPDWLYVERGQAIPSQDHPSRRIPGAMGTTAIYLGDGIAIHGTQNPELLLNPDPDARRVSHGCIRLTDEAARELMHLVDVGMPVLVF
jgi:lipoprotein-anchoring transpeptidase ErfK/SrfK